jgi:glyoxylase-like metal-dependent hydrolase (beta-lactamase superfamily II)
MTTRINFAVTSGTFSLDGQTFDVDNNVWVVGDDRECVIIDAPHHLGPIVELVGDRTVVAVLCTHAHDDHVRVAPDLGAAVNAPVLLHPADAPVWALTHRTAPDGELSAGQQIPVGDTALTVLHTPGHSPGSVCFLAESLGVVFTGDTLFAGGPGATGRSYSDPDLIVASIRARLLTLPDATVVKAGHGEDTTIGAERPGIS